MRINRSVISNNSFRGNRSINLASALKDRGIKFDRIMDIMPNKYIPSMISFAGQKERILFIDRSALKCDPGNKSFKDALDYCIDNAAIAVRNELEFRTRDLLKHTDCFSFTYDIRTKYFLITDTDSEICHQGQFNCLSILNESKVIDTDHDMVMKGAFNFDATGRIAIVEATVFKSLHRSEEANILARIYFYELGLGLKSLGCPDKTAFRDYPSPIKAFQGFLKKNEIFSLGDVLRKFAPQKH